MWTSSYQRRYVENSEKHNITISSPPGIPIRPDQPIIDSTKPGTITMTLSVAASGAGATGSFAFIISSLPSIDMMPSTYSFPMYIDQQKVSVFISNIKDGIVYTFNVSASNAYGTSQPVAMTWIGTGGLWDVAVNRCTYL